MAMSERFYAGAYWGARREDAESCTQRLDEFLGALARVHPLLGEWFEPGARLAIARERPVPRTPQALQALLLAGRNRDDTHHAVIENLGFSASMWNGQEPQVGLRVGCGCYSRWVGNAVVLDLPPAEGRGRAVYRPGAALRIMTALVACWQPEWATLTSDELRRAQQIPPHGPVVGWLTYLARPRQVDAGRLPDGVVAEEMADGTLITIRSDVTQVSATLITTVREALSPALLPNA
jgi:Immunity protein 52